MKVCYVTFNGELMCFGHALFNAIDADDKGNDVKIIIEGSSTKLIKDLYKEDNPFHKFFKDCLDRGLIEGVCKACANKMGTLAFAKAQGLPILDEAFGHPSLQKYLDEGYEIISL